MDTKTLKLKWFLLKYSLLKRNATSYYKELCRNQHLSADELDALNWNRTKALLQYAYENVPYYRNRFDSIGLHPRDIVDPVDYKNVPLLRRADLREHFSELISVEAKLRALRLSTTGGSTGEPVKVYHQKQIVRSAAFWRMLGWWDLSPADDFARVYRHDLTISHLRFIDRIGWWPTKKILLKATNFSDETIMKFVEQFQRIRPKLLFGYVGAIDNVAAFLESNAVTVPPPRAVWVTSSPTSTVQEVRIQRAFGAPVYDQYGCCEVHALAAQCAVKRGLHMFHDIRRIEFLNEQDQPSCDGELGRIAITDLENYYFPIIRYLNGDMGRSLSGQCDCGISLPLMDKVMGRVSDTLRLPSGRCVSGDYMTTIFDEAPDAVRRFQVYQHADYSITLHVVPNSRCHDSDKLLDLAVKKIRNAVCREVAVRLQKTDQIPDEKGKLRFIVSEIK